MPTCQLCHDLVRDEKSGRRLCLEFTPDCLQQSVLANECQSCAILFKGISLMQDNTWSFVADVSRVYGYGLATEWETLVLEVYFIEDRPRLMLEFFYLDRPGLSALPWRAIRPRTLTNGHPLCQKAMHWVRTRLEICSKRHPICPAATKAPFPKRILALQKTSGGDISVKVMEAGNKATLGIYATLSHRWGLKLPCVMTTNNQGSRLCGIPWAELPQTFQDAIRYCLELGISFLWIDALCIMQDDPEDWQEQSAEMADIYQNSYINLAATSSDCGSAGCFPNESLAFQERSLEVPSMDGQVYEILIRQRIPHWAVPPTMLSTRENPLLSRGWVFQERVLSPRVLHFCKQELVWECGQETLCECGSLPKTRNLKLQFALAARLHGEEEATQSENPDEEVRGRRSSLSGGSDSEDEKLPIPQRSPEELAQLESEEARRAIMNQATNQWHDIVEQYSALELTKQRDRLPALSGLAERMAPFLGDYLAGLWRKSFLPDLRWRVDKLVPGLQRPAEYRGPSWSWVSTKTKVAFLTREEITPLLSESDRVIRDRREHMERERLRGTSRLSLRAFNSPDQLLRNRDDPTLNIVSCTVDTKGKNKFGEVSSALLIVEGNLKATKIWEDSMVIPDSLVPPRFEVDVGRRVEVAVGLQMELGIKMDPGVTSWRFPFFADYILSADGPYKISSSDVVFLLSISPNICLVLSKTSLRLAGDTSIFRRIGILKLPHELQVRYGINVMKGSQRTKVAII